MLQAPKKAKKRAEGANSNVFSMFEQAQIQEFKEMEQMFTAFHPDVAGHLDYKNLFYIITHGEEKDQE
ncbi:unnamed protein product [Coregonus sp. 'balchen']|nr:unnamed protein product [Coregonus sp. 'balchen']